MSKRIDPMWQCVTDGCEDAVFGSTARCRRHVGPDDEWVDGRFRAATVPEPTVLPDRLYDVTAEWLWREYGHVYERDWNRDAWRLLVMVRGVIDEYVTTPAALPE